MNERDKVKLRDLENAVYMAERDYNGYREAENMIMSRLSREMTATAGEAEYDFILEQKNQELSKAIQALEDFKASL